MKTNENNAEDVVYRVLDCACLKLKRAPTFMLQQRVDLQCGT